MEEKNNENLLTKLRHALTVRLVDSKLCQRLPALTLATVLALNLTACTIGTLPEDTTGGPTYSTTAPLYPGTTPVIPGTTTAPTTTTGPSTTTSPTTTKPTTPAVQRSEMFMNVVNSLYYKDLIKSAKQNMDFYNTAYFDPHPYAFLEDEGYNTLAIKQGQLKGETYSYILNEEPNNLYIFTRIQNENDHYTNYLLTYELTDQEVKDYKYAHSKNGTFFLYQAFFLNDEISRTRDPINVQIGDITEECLNGLKRSAKDFNSLLTTEFKDVCVTDIDTYEVYGNTYANLNATIMPHYTTSDPYCTHGAKILIAKCNGGVALDNGALQAPNYFDKWALNIVEYEIKDITFFKTQNPIYAYCEDFTE